MCGRYLFTLVKEDVEREYKVRVNFDVKPRYNIAPGQDVVCLLGSEQGRKVEAFRWGLIPSWAKDTKFGYKLINARAETLFESRMFKPLAMKKRCLVLADGFYEWQKTDEGKIPMCIRLKSHNPFGFAGIWETWIPPESKVPLHTCSIVTTTPNSLMKTIHHRMPVIVLKELEKVWLNPEISDENVLKKIFKPYPSNEMEAYPVSKMVNSPKMNLPECMEPVKA